MLRHSIALVAITLFSSFHLHAQQEEPLPTQAYPTIPTAALDPYQISIVDENVEAMRLPRLRLTGRKVLQMDILADHISIPSKGQCSAQLAVTNAPDFKIEFFAFPTSSFQHPLNDKTLNLYLEGLRLRHKPAQDFTILEESAFTERGRSKFRILGQRAMTIRYSSKKEHTTMVFGENWIERDKTIYMVRVSAPVSAFNLQFEDARTAFNSLSEVK
ncbi:hypothetical protein ACWPKO_03915 [Coraliomargarita sp. W4R53]